LASDSYIELPISGQCYILLRSSTGVRSSHSGGGGMVTETTAVIEAFRLPKLGSLFYRPTPHKSYIDVCLTRTERDTWFTNHVYDDQAKTPAGRSPCTHNGDKNNRQTEALSPPGSQFKPELKQALSARIGG
ncbi:hypothetical protein KCU92_g374, partial [Aureobasidium melanogenum]